MISIEKRDSGYTARATPPHTKTEWQSDEPLPARRLIDLLFAQGAHQTDIGDAMYAADPDWLQNLNQEQR